MDIVRRCFGRRRGDDVNDSNNVECSFTEMRIACQTFGEGLLDILSHEKIFHTNDYRILKSLIKETRIAGWKFLYAVMMTTKIGLSFLPNHTLFLYSEVMIWGGFRLNPEILPAVQCVECVDSGYTEFFVPISVSLMTIKNNTEYRRTRNICIEQRKLDVSILDGVRE